MRDWQWLTALLNLLNFLETDRTWNNTVLTPSTRKIYQVQSNNLTDSIWKQFFILNNNQQQHFIETCSIHSTLWLLINQIFQTKWISYADFQLTKFKWQHFPAFSNWQLLKTRKFWTFIRNLQSDFYQGNSNLF